MIVVDASAVVELVLESDAGASVGEHVRGHRLQAPAHVDVEVVGAVRRAVARQWVNEREGLLAVDEFTMLHLRRWPLPGLMARAYALGATHAVADAVYLTLAEGLQCRLVTCDGRLARSHGHRADVELVT